jgi:AcrR family transcriptional regulator
VVDHDARRRQIAEAVWAVIALRGLEAVSLREVAAQAGVSMGMVQHYFRSKDAMLLFACEHIVERADEMAAAMTAGSDDPASPRTIIRNVLTLGVPLRAEERLATSVWFAFVTRAAIDEELAALIRGSWSGTHDLMVEQLHRAQERGEVAVDVDVRREAIALVALIDGLVSHVMVGHYTSDEAMAAVDLHLDRLFAGTPHPPGPRAENHMAG